MDHLSNPLDRRLFLLMGGFLVGAAVACILTGETIEARHGFVYRAEEPKRFWWNVVTYFLLGLFFVGLFLYQNSN